MKILDFDKDHELVLVYGSLKTGYNNDHFLQHSEKIGHDVTHEAKFEMVDLDEFPGIIPGEYHIAGEVWKVNQKTLRYLDDLEGYPELYDRIKVNMNVNGPTWMYVLTPDAIHHFANEINDPQNNSYVKIANSVMYWSKPFTMEGKEDNIKRKVTVFDYSGDQNLDPPKKKKQKNFLDFFKSL